MARKESGDNVCNKTDDRFGKQCHVWASEPDTRIHWIQGDKAVTVNIRSWYPVWLVGFKVKYAIWNANSVL